MIELRNLCKSYEGRVVVDDVSMTIEDASLTVLIGPSGCGKSTTMRMINRLIVPDSGQVLLDGRDVATADLETLRRGIGYAIQAVGLFPHRTVAQNIGTVPRLLGWPEAKIAARVNELLNLLNLPAGARSPTSAPAAVRRAAAARRCRTRAGGRSARAAHG